MLPMRIELIISSLQDWCLTTMALEALWLTEIVKHTKPYYSGYSLLNACNSTTELHPHCDGR